MNMYGGMGDMADYLVNFVNDLDPNGEAGIPWPMYSVTSPHMLTFRDDIFRRVAMSTDTHREKEMDFITKLSLANPI